MDANNRNNWFLDPGPLSPWIDQFEADLAAQRYWHHAKRFFIFLQQAGVVPASPQSVPPFPLLDDYQDWLRSHRGLSEPTIARHLRDLKRLVPELGTPSLASKTSCPRHNAQGAGGSGSGF